MPGKFYMPKPLTMWIMINWKILKEMGIPDHLTRLWENCMQAKKQQLEPDMEQQIDFKSGKECSKAVYWHPAYLTYMQSIMQNARLDEAQAGIKTAGRNINNLIYADDTNPYGRKWRGTKEPLDESERGEWKS